MKINIDFASKNEPEAIMLENSDLTGKIIVINPKEFKTILSPNEASYHESAQRMILAEKTQREALKLYSLINNKDLVDFMTNSPVRFAIRRDKHLGKDARVTQIQTEEIFVKPTTRTKRSQITETQKKFASTLKTITKETSFIIQDGEKVEPTYLQNMIMRKSAEYRLPRKFVKGNEPDRWLILLGNDVQKGSKTLKRFEAEMMRIYKSDIAKQKEARENSYGRSGMSTEARLSHSKVKKMIR